MQERIRRISGISKTHTETWRKYEFDKARMSSIVKNIFFGEEREIISPEGRIHVVQGIKCKKRDLDLMKEIRRSHIKAVPGTQ